MGPAKAQPPEHRAVASLSLWLFGQIWSWVVVNQGGQPKLGPFKNHTASLFISMSAHLDIKK